MSLKSVDSNGFKEEVVDESDLVFSFWWASWCTACKSMENTIKELSEEVSDIKFVGVNVDRNREIADQYNIRGVPSFLIFKDGELVDRDVAAKTKKQLKEMIKEAKK
ncbi:thiol reductase thioredoxin [archaeon SCG-AAA382B04]|nr:thiol reductase thioredoxin [archaeon SCG-AAA382B04]